jgi:hypothetical protein
MRSANKRASLAALVEGLETRRLLAATISGKVLQDVTGNGNSADDIGMSGVTVNLVRDVNNNGILDLADGAPIASTTSASGSGAYSFSGLAAGRYFIREVTPSNAVRTGPAVSAGYSVIASGSNTYSGKNFDNYVKTFDRNAVSGISYLINGSTVVTSLPGNVHENDTVTVRFTLSSTQTVGLVAYHDPTHLVPDQELFDSDVQTLGAGKHTLTVKLPDCFFQIDFIGGPAIDKFGPNGSNIRYSAEGRLIGTGSGGIHPCEEVREEPGSISGCVFSDLNRNGKDDDFTLGVAANFGGLGLTGTAITISSGNSVVTGDMGVGGNGKLDFSGGGIVTGAIRKDPTATVNITGGSIAAGGVITQDMSAITTAVKEFADDAATLAPMQSFGSITSGTTIHGNGGLNVIKIGSINLQGGSVLTLAGGANDIFIINVTGTLTAGGGSAIKAGLGVATGHVLFNVVGDINTNGNSYTDGTYLTKSANITISGGVHFGEFISGGSFLKFQSGPKVTNIPFQPVTECLAGVTINLSGKDNHGNTITRTTVTTSSGYKFDNLPPGTYMITEVQPAGYADGPDFAGTLGGTVGNDVISNIVLGSGQHGEEYNFSEFLVV